MMLRSNPLKKKQKGWIQEGSQVQKSWRRSTADAHIASLRLLDDPLMQKVFDETEESGFECTTLLLKIILCRDDLKVKEVRVQRKLKSLRGRSLVLDILAFDEAGRPYNVEVQRNPYAASPRRMRLHASMLDSHLLKPGEDFKAMPDSYVIVIFEKDRHNLPILHVDRTIRETGEDYGDGSHIIHVNAGYAFTDESPLAWLMHDFKCREVAKMHYRPLAKRVDYFKNDEMGKNTMSSLWTRELNKTRKQSFAEGEAKGRIKGMLSLLKSAMHKNNWSFSQAADHLAVSEDDRQQLLKLWPAGATL